jgi:hypothetical protein
MKNIIVITIVTMLALSPVALPVPVLAASASETQTMLLIQLLMEKVKTLQAELALLIKEKAAPVKVEITEQNTDYKAEVKPLLDSLEEKEKARKVIQSKFDEKKCTKPVRTVIKGVVRFSCKSSEFEFSATSTSFVLTTDITVAKLAKAYGLNSSEIQIVPAIYAAPIYKDDSPVLVSPAKAVISASKDLTLLAKQMETLDKEITDLRSKIEFLKTRYGI